MSDKHCIPLFSLKTQEKICAFLLAGREEWLNVWGQTDLGKNVHVKQSEISALKSLINLHVRISPLKSVQQIIFVE